MPSSPSPTTKRCWRRPPPQFRPVMTAHHATGCRPAEACKITAENFDAEAGVIKLVEHKTDATGTLRLIFLTPEVCEMLKGLAERHRTGALLRTREGKPWNAQLINQQVRRPVGSAGAGRWVSGARVVLVGVGDTPAQACAAQVGHHRLLAADMFLPKSWDPALWSEGKTSILMACRRSPVGFLRPRPITTSIPGTGRPQLLAGRKTGARPEILPE